MQWARLPCTPSVQTNMSIENLLRKFDIDLRWRIKWVIESEMILKSVLDQWFLKFPKIICHIKSERFR